MLSAWASTGNHVPLRLFHPRIFRTPIRSLPIKEIGDARGRDGEPCALVLLLQLNAE
jgi:hypothetical protein